jgi:hypothetical protein
MENQLKTPVLFLIYRRPDTTKRVFEQIRKAQPRQLFIAADGPKRGEEEKCKQAREEVMNNIDWICEVKTLFRDKNLGCKYAVSGAIDWFFQNVEEGIILEDDTLPNQSFFRFCEELLEKYRDDERIMHISGYNPFGKLTQSYYSYIFSKYPLIWGWATWKRAWRLYDVNIKTFPTFKKEDKIHSVFFSSEEKKYKLKILTKLYNGEINTWDYQWDYCVFSNSGLSIIPTVNVVKNIGFLEDSTHTRIEDKRIVDFEGEIVFPLTHQIFTINNRKKDKYLFKCFIKKRCFVKIVKFIDKVFLWEKLRSLKQH